MGESNYPSYLDLIPSYSSIDTADEGMYFDSKAAKMAIDFYQLHLKFIEGGGAGKAFILQEWQKAIIGSLLGWKRSDGLRRYREAFVFIPRKNGKSPTAAGLIDYFGFCEEEGGAQIYSSASSAKQAELIYRHAAGMIRKNPYLKNRANIYKGNYKKIEFYDGDTFYQALQSKAETNEGLNSYLIVNDELHTHEDRSLIDVLENSTASREQPLIVHITTAGWDKNSICYEKYDYACKVRDGIIKDASFLPVIYEIKEEDFEKWDTEEVWRYCNPNLGVSVQLDYLKRQAQKAKDIPAYESSFRRYHLNQWVSNEKQWLDSTKFALCSGAVSKDKKLDWYVCVDLSSSQDLTAVVLVAQDEEEVFHVIPYSFIPEECARMKEEIDHVPYSLWKREGFLNYTEGDVIDYGAIRDFIVRLRDKEGYNIKEVVVDPYNAQQLIIELSNTYKFEVVPYGQGIKNLNYPAKKYEQLVLSQKLRYEDNDLYKWCASNVQIKVDENENIKPIKINRIKRIDPIIATLMGIGRIIIMNDETKGESVYASGVFTLD